MLYFGIDSAYVKKSSHAVADMGSTQYPIDQVLY